MLYSLLHKYLDILGNLASLRPHSGNLMKKCLNFKLIFKGLTKVLHERFTNYSHIDSKVTGQTNIILNIRIVCNT